MKYVLNIEKIFYHAIKTLNMNNISQRHTITDAVSQCNVPVYFSKTLLLFANLNEYLFSGEKNTTKTKILRKTKIPQKSCLSAIK